MAGFVNIPEVLSKDYNFLPLEKTWYEQEVTTDPTTTFRFAKRRDHSGVLIQINNADFLDSQA